MMVCRTIVIFLLLVAVAKNIFSLEVVSKPSGIYVEGNVLAIISQYRGYPEVIRYMWGKLRQKLDGPVLEWDAANSIYYTEEYQAKIIAHLSFENGEGEKILHDEYSEMIVPDYPVMAKNIPGTTDIRLSILFEEFIFEAPYNLLAEASIIEGIVDGEVGHFIEALLPLAQTSGRDEIYTVLASQFAETFRENVLSGKGSLRALNREGYLVRQWNVKYQKFLSASHYAKGLVERRLWSVVFHRLLLNFSLEDWFTMPFSDVLSEIYALPEEYLIGVVLEKFKERKQDMIGQLFAKIDDSIKGTAFEENAKFYRMAAYVLVLDSFAFWQRETDTCAGYIARVSGTFFARDPAVMFSACLASAQIRKTIGFSLSIDFEPETYPSIAIFNKRQLEKNLWLLVELLSWITILNNDGGFSSIMSFVFEYADTIAEPLIQENEQMITDLAKNFPNLLTREGNSYLRGVAD